MKRIHRFTLVSLFLTGILLAECPIFGTAGTGNALPGLHSVILYSISDLQFSRADSLLDISLELDPRDAGTLYLQNYLEFLDAVISGDRQSYERYLAASGNRIGIIRPGIKNDPGSLSYLSSIYLQSSFLCAYHGEMFKAVRNFYNSHHTLRQSEKRNPGYAGNSRIRGLITLVTGSVPDEYRWLLKIFGMDGETGEGFGYLEKYHEASVGAERLEACLLLLYARHTIDPGKHSGDAYTCCANDSLTLCRYVSALEDLSSGNSLGVVEKLPEHRQEKGEREFLYLDLLQGEAMLNNLDTGAHIPLERFARNHRGDHYKNYAWHKLSWCYALNGEWDLYREARQEVLRTREPLFDADRQSLSEALDTHPLNIFLLKGRLLFDGGHYREALVHMVDSSTGRLINRRDSLEYPYRLARIYEHLGDTAIAIAYYEQVIASGSGEAWYFAPNAALHLGMVYEDDGNPDKALKYYRICLKINESAYKKSINYKARQGIRRLEN